MTLYRNGQVALDDNGNPIRATLTAENEGADGKWRYAFEHLPYTDPDGAVYEYSATEQPVDGYTASISGENGKTSITNKHVPETTRVDGQKLWSGDTEDARPASVTVSLLADGVAKKSQIVIPDKDGNWSYSFENLLKYRDEGTEIKYTVEEIVTDTAGRSYTNEVTGSAAEGYTITNTYHPYGELFVSKAVKDVTDVSKDKEFTLTFEFTRTVEGEEQPVTNEYAYDVLDENEQVISSGTIASNGTIAIKGGQTIHVKEMDEYIQYKVSEADADGFFLTSSNGLSGTIKPNETSQASLTNTYRANGSLSPAVIKTLTDKASKRREFSFKMFRVDGGEETFIGTGYNEKPTQTVQRDDGTTEYTVAPVRFGSLEYTQADVGKTYHYVIRENVPGEATNAAGQDYATYHGAVGVSGPWTYKGVTYDETEYLLDVAIEDNGDGTLTVTPTYKKDGILFFDEEVKEASFKNEYHATGEVELKAWKDLKGRKPAEGEFTFELLGDEVDEKTGASKVIQTKFNDANGEVTFDKIAYDQTDIGKTYHYYVREVKGNDPTLTYDENVYGYTVIVYDDGDGHLSLSSTRCGVKVTEVPVEGEFSFRTIEADGTHNGWNHVGRRIGNFHRKYLQGGRYWAKWITNNPEATAEFNAIWENDVNGVTVRSGTLGSDENVKNAMEKAYRYLYDTSTARFRVGDVLVYDSGYTAGFSGYIPIRTYLNDGGRTYHTWLIGVDQACDYLYEPEGMTENEPVVFTNELKPGGFTVTKLVTDAEGADPDQEFKFKVVLTGDVTDDTVTGYTLSEVDPSQYQSTSDNSNDGGKGPLAMLGDLFSDAGTDAAASIAKLNPFAPTKAYAAESGVFNGMNWSLSDYGELTLGKGGGVTQTLALPTSSHDATIYPWFNKRNDIKIVNIAGPIKVTGDATDLFYEFDCVAINNLRLLDTSAVTSMKRMFYECKKLESVDLSNFDTSNVTSFEAMFYSCESLKTIDCSKFDTSKAKSIQYMFEYCSSLETLDISGFDLNSIGQWGISSLLYNNGALKYVNMKGWRNAYKLFATNNYPFSYMGFLDSEAPALETIDVSDWDLQGTGNVQNTFNGLAQVKHIIGVGTWKNTSEIVNMNSMFYYCRSLETLDLSGLDTSGLRTATSMFGYCDKLVSLDISSLDLTLVTGQQWVNNMFDMMPSLRKIKLGSKFVFFGPLGYSNKLPEPQTDTKTWIRIDGEAGPYTRDELVNEWTDDKAGTWVWATEMYKVVFDANGGSGSMPNQLYVIEEDGELPANQFKRFGYTFAGWKDADGNTYDDMGSIPANTYAKDQVVTLTAQWEPVDTSVNMNNGEFEFTLHANERATFDNIPAGVGYAVYEETPDGWVLVKQENISGSIPAADYANASFTNKYQPGTTSAQFNGVKLLDGVAAEKDAYTFELLENGKVIQTKKTLDGGFIQFDVITYEKKDVGTHTYTIREVDPEDSTIDIDRHTETVTVEVTEDDMGNLSSKATYDEDGIRFLNKTRPGELRLTKVADGLTDANKDDEFTFEIELTNEKGMPLGTGDQVYWYVEGAVADSGDEAGDDTNTQQPQDAQAPNAAANSSDEAGDDNTDAQQPQDAQAPKASSLIPRGGLLSAGARALAGLFAPTKALAAESDVRAWYPWGDCQWGIDPDGCLWIRPSGGAAVGTLGKPTGNSPGTSPWYAIRNSIKSVRVPEGKKVKLYQDSSNLFYGFSRLTSIDLSSFDASGVTSEGGMRSMFDGCSSLASIDLSVLDTSNVKNMYRMFDGCSSLASIDLSVLDTTNVKSMYGMFQDCRSLAEVNLSGLKTSSLENMQFMFRNCASLRTADLSGLDTSNVTDTSYLFQNCSSLTSVNLSGLDLSSVTDMNYMFQKCTSLTSIDMSGLDVSSVKGMNSMFDNCTSLTSADLSDLDASSVTDMSFMFRGCKSLTSANLSGLDASSVTGMGYMFEGCSRLQALDLSDFKTFQPRYLAYMFQSCSALSTLDLSSLDTSSVTNMYNMFGYMYNLSEVTLGPKFTFRGDGGENPRYSSLPDASNSSPYTGKWVKVDDPSLALTAQELAEDYDASYAGTWVWESANGRVFYKPNGGVTTAETAVVKEAGETVTIPDKATTSRPGFKLTGWNTAADGSGTSYEPGGSYTDIVELGENLVLYAQWEQTDERDYTVRHYQQPVSLSTDHADYALIETEVLQADKDTEVTPETKDYDGYVAPERQTATVADDGSTVVEYYYDLVTSDVSFDGHGATSGYTDGQKLVGAVAAKLNANGFSKTGSLFTGWNTAADGSGTGYTDGQQVKASDLATEPGATVTLYAQWMDNPNEPLTPTAGKITVTCKAGETIVLPDLPAGTKYTITEVGLPGGWSQSGDIDNGSGTIAANTTPEATARNTYTARGTVQLEAHKALEGGELKEGMFEFELLNDKGTVLQTKTNDAVDTAKTITNEDGKTVDNPWVGTAPVYFDAFQADQSWIGQTHTYTIREKVVSSDKTVTYDTHEETVTIEFYDAGHGQVAGKVTYDDDGALFSNKTNTTGLKIEKQIEAPAELSETKFEFTVTLKDAEDKALTDEYNMVITHLDGSEEESTIASGGTVSLAGGETAEISGLPIGGTYEVSEAKAEGWEATSTGASGTLEAEKVAIAKFNNKWDENQPAKGTAKIVAHKTLEGGTISEDDEFVFQLLGPDGSVIQQKTVDKTGASASDITFDPISFSDADANKTYTYRVREVAGKDSSVKYDSTNHTVLVSVGPNTGNGLLATDVRYVKYDSEGVVQESTTSGSASSDDLTIEAELIGDVPEGGFAPGDTVSFLVTATNTGTEAEGSNMRDLKATDNYGALDYKASGLAAGRSTQFGVDHVVTAADVVSGKVTETITVEATTVNGPVSCEVTLTLGTETWTEVTENPATFVNEVSRTRIEGVKEWNDNGDASKRPASVTIKLLQNGIVAATTTTTAEQDWKWSFENLLATDSQGNEIEYTVAETNVRGYSSAVSKNDDGSWTITNTPLTSVDITKTWVDENDVDELRPSADEFAAMVHLYAGDTEVTDVTPTVTDNGDNTYTVTWSDLAKCDEDGVEIAYTVTEDVVPGYESDVEGAVEPGNTITNTRKEALPTEVEILVTKTLVGREWDNGDEFGFSIVASPDNPDAEAAPKTSNVTITAEDEGYTKSFGKIVLTKPGTYTYTVTEDGGNLPYVTYDTAEHVVTFVAELDADGNISLAEGTQEVQTVAIENTFELGSRDISVTKVWDDADDADAIRPDEIQVQLNADGEAVGEPVTLSEANGWAYVWTGLDATKDEEAIAYTVDEVSVPDGYTKTVSGDATTGFVITNAHKPGPKTTQVAVKKVWDDGAGASPARPKSIQVQLYADGQPAGEVVTLSEANGWAHTWTGLDAVHDGKKVTYSVDEVSVPDGYTKTVSGDSTTGFVITNTRKPEIPRRLPKTGDLLDPAVMQVLGAAGAALAGAGIVLAVSHYLRRRENER